MKKLSIFMCAFLMLISLSACQPKEKVCKRDTSKGSVTQINLAKMEAKLEAKDTFVVVFSTHTCGYCLRFHEMLDTYLENHNVEIYNVYLDEEKTTVNENREIVNRHFEEFNSTPGVFYVVDGKNVSYLPNQSDGVNEEYFENWVIENNIDCK